LQKEGAAALRELGCYRMDRPEAAARKFSTPCSAA
jgi:hypothetical protein